MTQAPTMPLHMRRDRFAPVDELRELREGEGVRDRLGFAVGPERAFLGAFQSFTGGQMVWTGADQALIRAYLANGEAMTMPDPASPR